MYNENNRQMGMATRKNMGPMTRLAPNSGPSVTRDIPGLDLRSPGRRGCDGTLRDLSDDMMRSRCDGERRGDDRRESGRCGDDRRGDSRCGDDRRSDGRCGDDRRSDGRCDNDRRGDDRRECGRCGDGRRNDGRCGESRCNKNRCGESRCNENRCGESRCNENRCGGEPRFSAEGTTCSKCTEGRCGGWGLYDHPLAMVYSPCQSWREVYAPDVALARGTMFSELDLPFEPSKFRKGCM
ncbi:MAG: spore coat associated protein CotJA [Eubacteriales bacterium]